MVSSSLDKLFNFITFLPDLFLHLLVTGELPQLVVIGIQEIVELTASQIVASDPAKKAEWERCILKCLNERILHDSNQYVLLRSSQLVGTALTLFAQRSEVARIRRVEFSKVKVIFHPSSTTSPPPSSLFSSSRAFVEYILIFSPP